MTVELVRQSENTGGSDETGDGPLLDATTGPVTALIRHAAGSAATSRMTS